MEDPRNGTVFTPPFFVNQMLDALPHHVWSDHTLSWLDPCAGLGQFPVEIYKRLMEGLKSKIPSERKRKLHILTKMLFMMELNKNFAKICKKNLDPDNAYELKLFDGDSLAVNWKRFDIVIGNPPYNSGAQPLYHKFVTHFIDKCKYLLFITPSRWFSSGRGLSKFREMMLARKDIRIIQHFEDAKSIFPTVQINGGVSYFLKDSSYRGQCKFNGELVDLDRYDVLVEKKWHKLIDRMKDEPKLSELYQGRHYQIETNDSRLLNKPVKGSIVCHVSLQKGDKQWIKMQGDGWWKVMTARATGKERKFDRVAIARPDEVHSGSLVSFRVKSLKEARSLASYLRCSLPNLMMGLRKNSQDLRGDTLKWVPLVPLDREWDDGKVEEWFRI